MRFILLDKVTELVPGQRIAACKAVSLAEEYLADHFPNFPALPGVLTIEALTQSAAMLVRITNNFAHSMIVLAEARNVKYKRFVRPGSLLSLSVKARNINENASSFIADAQVDGQSVAEARLKLRHFNLADNDSTMASVDQKLIAHMRQRAKLVGAC